MPHKTGLLAVLLSAWLLASCSLLGDSDKTPPEPLPFNEIRVHYEKYGGWIPRSTLLIEPTGEAEAALIGEDTLRGTTTLSQNDRERLSELLAWFPTYRRRYRPEKYVTDQNSHVLVLSCRGGRDTVSVYYPAGTSMPSSLRRTIQQMEELHEKVLPSHP